MALIKTGSIVADISGKVGDNIYSRNASGPYVKAFAAPTITPSTYTAAAQQALADANAAWAALSDVEYNNWVHFSAQYPRRTFHNGYQKIDPRALFISCYINQVYCGITPGPQPIPPGNPLITRLYFDATLSNQFNVGAIGGTGSTDYYILYYASFPASAATRSINTNPLYFFYSLFWSGSGYYNLKTQYIARCGGALPAADERVFLKARVIHKFSGLELGELVENSLGYSAAGPFQLGYPTIGPSVTPSLASFAMPINPTGNGTITSLWIYHNSAGGNLQFAVYDSLAGIPNARLYASGNVAAASGPGWQQHILSSPVSISNGVTYFIAADFETSSNVYFIGSGPVRYYNTASGYSLPDPYVYNGSGAAQYSFYAEGTYS